MWLILALLAPLAHATDCDASALDRTLQSASPARIAPAYTRLAECDPTLAAKRTAKAFDRMGGNEDAPAAVAAAATVGAYGPALSWAQSAEPHLRAQSITAVGKACASDPSVGQFFLDAHDELGDAFWEDRWFRGLADCPNPGVRDLLTAALSNPTIGRESRNRSMFFALLEVYGRNLGQAAIPVLAGYLKDARDEAEATVLVNLFADAAQVGSTTGVNTEAAALATQAIVEAAPTLPGRALDRARDTLNALGSADQASALAKYKFPERYVDGVYTYGVAVRELATCKNGKTKEILHVGTVTQSGSLWPDQLEIPITSRLQSAYTLDAAAKCKGTSEITVSYSSEPLVTDGLEAYISEQTEAFEASTSADKSEVVRQENVPFAP